MCWASKLHVVAVELKDLIVDLSVRSQVLSFQRRMPNDTRSHTRIQLYP